MPEPTDPIAQDLLKSIKDADPNDEKVIADKIKTLKNYAEAKKLLEPEPEPVPEPTGFKAFVNRNSGDLIKAGSTLVIVTAIAAFEAKGDLIFRSKAAKFI